FRRRSRTARKYERHDLPPAIQGRDVDESSSIPEGASAPGGATANAHRRSRSWSGRPARRLLECLAVHARVRSVFRKRTDARPSPSPRTRDRGDRDLFLNRICVMPSKETFMSDMSEKPTAARASFGDIAPALAE